MIERSRFKKMQRALADCLLTASAGYVGLSFFGPLWFPYDIAIAIVVGGLAWLIGDYRHRWWSIVPMRDRDHEFKLDRSKDK